MSAKQFAEHFALTVDEQRDGRSRGTQFWLPPSG
jgi:hypothetical protein